MLRIQERRNGFSLLEVILAIAILGGAMAVILQLVNLGMRSSVAARQRSEANLLCDTKMAEISAGILELKDYSATPIPENQDWLYSATVQESSNLGLLVVTMSVEQANIENPISVQIVRYVPDPDYDPTVEEETE